MAKAIAFEECNDESEDETIDAIKPKPGLLSSRIRIKLKVKS